MTQITEAEYRADPRMNVSLLVHGLTSMKHLRSEQLAPSGQSPAMRRGSMVHCYILEPEEFRKRYVVMPRFELDADNCSGTGKNKKPSMSKATTYYKGRVAEFEAANEGTEVIEASEIDWCERIRKAIFAAPEARELIETCDREVVLFGEIEGVECKGRLDLLSRVLYVDIKTAACVVPHSFGASAARLHYTKKVAFYRELARINGYPLDEVKFIAVESEKPHDVVVSNASPIILDNGMDRLRPVLRDYKWSKANNVWPGISKNKVLELVVPAYSMEEDDELDWSEVES